MKLYLIEREQTIPVSVSPAWDFFVNPHNLSVITPDYMGFHIQDKSIGQKIYPNTLIRDKDHYALPLDPFSPPIHFLMVRKKLESIFAYRKEKWESLFQ